MLDQHKENDDLNKIVLSVKDGDLEGLKQELSTRYGNSTKIYNEYLKDGWTLMLHAVENLQFDIVRYLISKGSNVNSEAGEYYKTIFTNDFRRQFFLIDRFVDTFNVDLQARGLSKY